MWKSCHWCQKFQQGRNMILASHLWLSGYHRPWLNMRVLQTTRRFSRSSSCDEGNLHMLILPCSLCSHTYDSAMRYWLVYMQLLIKHGILVLFLTYTIQQTPVHFTSFHWWKIDWNAFTSTMQETVGFKDWITESHTLWLVEIIHTTSWMQARACSSWRTVFWKQLQPEAFCHWFYPSFGCF